MKKFMFMCLVAGAGTLSLPALAEETNSHAVTQPLKPGHHIERTLVGYEEKTIGRIIINGETYVGKGPLPKDVFNTLDTNKDGGLSEKEMFLSSNSKRRGVANFHSSDGTQGQGDYNVRGGSGVKVEDLTEDGSFFEAMDTNGDGFVAPDEFRLDIKQAAKKATSIEPAAGEESAPAPKAEDAPAYKIPAKPSERADQSYMGHKLNH